MRADSDAAAECLPELGDGVAAIDPVTREMMAHAAPEAAALAEGVAHGTAGPAEEPSAGAHEAVGPVVATMAAKPAVDAAGEATGADPEAFHAAPSGAPDALAQYNAKVVAIMRANTASATSLFAALVQARSIPEAMELNADHLRRQMEAMASQGRELAALAQRIALDAFRPPQDRDDR